MSLPYYETQQFQATLAGRRIEIVSKQGLPHWNEVSPAQRLLADAAAQSAGRILLVDTGPGAVAAALGAGEPRHEIVLIDTNAIAVSVAPQTLARNHVTHATVRGAALAPRERASFDVAVYEVPQHRKLARRRLLEIHDALREGGVLYLAGANNAGIQSVIADAEMLFGTATVLGYRERNRVARVTRMASSGMPAWASEPGIAPGSWFTFDAQIGGSTLHLHSLPGVFSYDRLDDGTALLLASLDAPRGLRVLDVGCGCGVIGLWAAREGARHVDLVDVNLLAVECAKQNIATLGIGNARALPSDALSAVAGQRYDLVVTNPPFHAGKSIDYAAAHAFIADARRALVPGGRLVLVANAFIPYARLVGTVFKDVGSLANNRRYDVLVAR